MSEALGAPSRYEKPEEACKGLGSGPRSPQLYFSVND
jgi:hypothetical protein